MRVMTVSADSAASFPKLSLSLASTPEELKEVQRLRYKVFVEAMGLDALRNHEGLERDEFDEFCDHLIVRDARTHEVVGTYRVLTPRGMNSHRSFYSENEFYLGQLESLRPRIIEAGRACIHPDYRSGGVIMMLWAGLAACMQRERAQFLIGCASVSLADGGHTINALYRKLVIENLAPPDYRVTPRLPYPLHEDPLPEGLQVPPLIKGYLRGGAWIGGDPAWDPDFHSADLFMILPLFRLDSRYARHYMKETETA